MTPNDKLQSIPSPSVVLEVLVLEDLDDIVNVAKHEVVQRMHAVIIEGFDPAGGVLAKLKKELIQCRLLDKLWGF